MALGILWFVLLGASLLGAHRWPNAKRAILAGSGLSWMLVTGWVAFVYLRT